MRDQLAAELTDIGSADEAATWAHRVLSAKNTLTDADAKQVENAFQVRLATLESATERDDGVPLLQAPHSSRKRGPESRLGQPLPSASTKSELNRTRSARTADVSRVIDDNGFVVDVRDRHVRAMTMAVFAEFERLIFRKEYCRF